MRAIFAACVLALAAAGRALAADPSPEPLARARALAKDARYEDAGKALDAIIAEKPRDFAAHELRGYCFMKLFRYDEACEAFERGDATDRYHYVNYGFCLRKAGRALEAQKAFASAQFVLSPEDSWTTYCRTQEETLAPLAGKRAVLALAQADDRIVAVLNGEPCAVARAGGDAAVALDERLRPGKNELRVLVLNAQGGWAYRVRLYLDGKEAFAAGAGRAAAGAGAFEDDRTVGVTTEIRLEIERGEAGRGPALASARSVVDFEDVRKRLRAADDLWAKKKRKEACELLDESRRRFPLLDCFPRCLAECYEELGLAAAAKEAREHFVEVRRKLAALAPDDAGALLALAAAAAGTGDYRAAEKAYRRAIALDAERAEGFVGLADALAHERLALPHGDSKIGELGREALAFADEAIARAPDRADAHCARGDALRDAGDAEGALAAYGRAVECEPADAQWIAAKASLAASAAREAAAAHPQDAAAAKAQGDALLRRMCCAEAAAEYERALALKPETPAAAACAGLAHELAGALDRAEAMYRRAAAKNDAPGDLARRRLARLRYFREAGVGRAPAIVGPGPVPVDFASGDEPAKRKLAEALAAIEKARPAIAAGLRSLPPLRKGSISQEDADAVDRIRALVLRAKGEDARRGLALIERQVGRRAGRRPKIDGALDEWGPADRVASARGGRIRELLATIDREDLYVAWKTAARPAPSADSAFWVQVYPARPDRPRLGVGLAGGEVVLIRTAPDGKHEEVRGAAAKVEWCAGEGLEARIPLSWLGGERRLRVESYVWSERAKAKLESIAEGGAPVNVHDGYAPALLALFGLAGDGDFLEPEDRLVLAIAVDSADYYALGDARLQDAVREDDRRMLRLARAIRAAEKAAGAPDLAEEPLAALLFWANRTVDRRPADGADYRRDTIAPATLEALLAFAQARGLAGARPAETLDRCERFLAAPRRWQCPVAPRGREGRGVSFSAEERSAIARLSREVAVDGRRVATVSVR